MQLEQIGLLYPGNARRNGDSSGLFLPGRQEKSPTGGKNMDPVSHHDEVARVLCAQLRYLS